MATKRWLGSATAKYDVWTLTVSGTMVSQTYTMTVNGKTVTYVAGGADTAAIILDALVAAWNASIAPEFMEMTALSLPVGGPTTSATFTGDTIGKPSTIAVSTGGAATFAITNTILATGPNDFTNAQNWSGGVAPANSDTLVFDAGNAACKYNLNSSLTGVTIDIHQGYAGTIGLPTLNSDSSVYSEYRTTRLTLAGGTAQINSTQVKRCNLAFGANTATVRVLATGQRIDNAVPVVLITGGDGSSSLSVSRGDIGVAFYVGQTATFPTVNIGTALSTGNDAAVVFGSGATLTTLTKNSGAVEVNGNVTTLTQGAAGGSLTISAGAVTTLTAYGGTVFILTTGAITTMNLYGSAIIDCDSDPRGKTVTNPINVYSVAVTIKDNQKTVNSGTLSLTTGGLASVNVQHGANTAITYV